MVVVGDLSALVALAVCNELKLLELINQAGVFLSASVQQEALRLAGES